MKKIFGLVSIMLSLSVVSASAETNIFVSATHNAASDGGMVHDIVVRASLEQSDANTMLIVKDESGDISVIDQGYADKNGNINYSFSCDEPGSYSGIINTEEDGQQRSFSFNILDSYASIIEQYNSADESGIEAVIDSTSADMLFDTKYYTEETKEQIAKNMLDECGSLTESNISEKFDKSIVTAYVYGDYDSEEKLEVIGYYNSTYFNLINQTEPENIYADFLDFSEKDKQKVFKRIEEKAPELSEFRNEFNEAVVMTAFNEFGSEELDAFLISNADYVTLDGYSDNTPSKRKKIITELKKATVKNVDDIIEAYEDVISTNNSSGGGSSSGGGGSSSGGGASSNKKPATTTWIPQGVGEQTNETTTEKVETVSSFNDMDSVEWAKEAVTALQKKGIVSGRGEGKFAPNDNVTRAEFTVMVVNAFLKADLSAKCAFTDIPADDWSYSHIATAYSNGIIYGLEDGSFGKNINITREDMATILHRVLSFTKKMPVVTSVNNTITDFDTVSDYAQNSVLMLSEIKVVNGVGDGYFLPKKNATRAEAAVMINNAMGVVAK